MDTTTIILAAILAVVNPWAFFELLRTTSARRERRRHAREELVDLLERQVVTQSDLPRHMVYEVASALAQKREVRLEDLYRPIAVLHDVLLRIRSNPVLTPDDRGRHVATVRAAIIGLKRSDGVPLLQEALDAVESSKALLARNRARRLLAQISENWATFDDQAAIGRLRDVRRRLGNDAERAACLRVLSGLESSWQSDKQQIEPDPARAGRDE